MFFNPARSTRKKSINCSNNYKEKTGSLHITKRKETVIFSPKKSYIFLKSSQKVMPYVSTDFSQEGEKSTKGGKGCTQKNYINLSCGKC